MTFTHSRWLMTLWKSFLKNNAFVWVNLYAGSATLFAHLKHVPARECLGVCVILCSTTSRTTKLSLSPLLSLHLRLLPSSSLSVIVLDVARCLNGRQPKSHCVSEMFSDTHAFRCWIAVAQEKNWSVCVVVRASALVYRAASGPKWYFYFHWIGRSWGMSSKKKRKKNPNGECGVIRRLRIPKWGKKRRVENSYVF